MCCLNEEIDDKLYEEYDCEDEYFCKEVEDKPKRCVSSLTKLKVFFDCVEVEDLENYRLLTLKDKVSGKGVIEYVVWIQVKIALGGSSQYSNTTVEAFTESVSSKILRWSNKLLNFEKSKLTESLFAFEEEVEVLEKPVLAEGGDPYKYFEELKKYNKKLIEKYDFFEVSDIHRAYGTYYEDYTHLLPQTDKEMIECVKEAIIKAETEDGHNYMERDGALSDYEIIARIKSLIRLHFLPYQTSGIMVDDSDTVHIRHSTTSYRYWFDGTKMISAAHWTDEKLPSYELFDYDFIAWLREFFNISPKEMMKDNEVLNQLCVSALEQLLWYGKDEYNLKQRANRFSNFKQFKSDFLSFLKERNIDYKNGGSGGPYNDGYTYSITNFDKGKTAIVKLEQKVLARQLSGQDTTCLEVDGRGSYIVAEISDDEVFKIAFETLSNKTQPRQSTLLDFI
jgi:hypothetical protein